MVCAGIFTGCVASPSAAPPLRPSESTPPPQNTDAPFTEFDATLYYVKAGTRDLQGNILIPDLTTLVEAQVRAPRAKEQSKAAAALQAYLEGPSESGLFCVPFIRTKQETNGEFPRLIRYERLGNIANVDVQYNLRPVEEKEWQATRIAIANILAAADPEIEYVNIYRDGAEPGYSGRPIGSIQPSQEMLDTQLAQLAQEHTAVYQTEYTEPPEIERNATLYFQDEKTGYIMAEERLIGIESPQREINAIYFLFDELLQGPSGAGLQRTLPPDLRLTRQPQISGIRLETGVFHTVADIYLNQSEQAYDETALFATLTLTLTGFCPAVNSVRIFFDTDPIAVEGETFLAREHFTPLLGHPVLLDIPMENANTLRQVRRPIPAEQENNPETRLNLFFEEAAQSMNGLIREDVETVYLAGSTAIVSLKAGAAAKLGSTAAPDEGETAGKERQSLYALVNTLTEMDDITDVWFLEEGERIPEYGRISLMNPLMRNPGLIIHE